jgi:hypothetical protein
MMRLLVGMALLLAAPETCAQRKVDKAVTEDKRSWGEQVSSCRVSIAWLAAPTGSAGALLDIVFRNEGSVAVAFPRSSMWFDYDFSVLTDAGVEAPLTGFGKQQRENLGYAAAAIMQVEPGKEYQSTVELSRLYDLPHSSAFTVQASKTFRDPNSQQFVTVHSNRLGHAKADPH